MKEFAKKLKHGDVDCFILIAKMNDGTLRLDTGDASFDDKCCLLGHLQAQIALDVVAVNMKHLLKE